jgi:hypothetical protein
MSAAEANRRYGRIEEKKAELPAAPAAATNGRSGTQQLSAASMLASAPTLANNVLRLAMVSFNAVSSR